MTILDAIRAISPERARVWARRYHGLPTGEGSGDSELKPYTGAYFNTLGAKYSHPNEFSGSDLYSLRCLGVDVKTDAGIFLLDEGAQQVKDLLSAIPSDRALADIREDEYEQHLGEQSPAWQLWDLIRANNRAAGKWHMGPTRVSKLMARKRPLLIPIEDSVVNRVIGSDAEDSWREWWTALTSDSKPLEDMADVVRVASERPDLSTLRALDIVLWMKGQHDDRCSAGAECEEAHIVS